MKFAATATFAAALVGLAVGQSATPTVTTPPSLVECQPAQFTVSGGTAPYILSILPGGQTGSAPLETLPTVDAAGTVTWDVDLPSGQQITIQVRDATGALNYSQQVPIQAGTDTSCVGANSSLSGSASQSSINSSGAISTAPSSAISSIASSRSSAASSQASVISSSLSRSSSAASSAPSSAPSSAAASSSSAPAPSSSAAGNALYVQTGALGAVAAVVMAAVA